MQAADLVQQADQLGRGLDAAGLLQHGVGGRVLALGDQSLGLGDELCEHGVPQAGGDLVGGVDRLSVAVDPAGLGVVTPLPQIGVAGLRGRG